MAMSTSPLSASSLSATTTTTTTTTPAPYSPEASVVLRAAGAASSKFYAVTIDEFFGGDVALGAAGEGTMCRSSSCPAALNTAACFALATTAAVPVSSTRVERQRASRRVVVTSVHAFTWGDDSSDSLDEKSLTRSALRALGPSMDSTDRIADWLSCLPPSVDDDEAALASLIAIDTE